MVWKYWNFFLCFIFVKSMVLMWGLVCFPRALKDKQNNQLGNLSPQKTSNETSKWNTEISFYVSYSSNMGKGFEILCLISYLAAWFLFQKVISWHVSCHDRGMYTGSIFSQHRNRFNIICKAAAFQINEAKGNSGVVQSHRPKIGQKRSIF